MRVVLLLFASFVYLFACVLACCVICLQARDKQVPIRELHLFLKVKNAVMLYHTCTVIQINAADEDGMGRCVGCVLI